MSKSKPTFAIKTLGCKVNQYEEQVLRESLIKQGLQESSHLSADIGIINSCTVTQKADAKTRQLIRKIKKDNPAIRVVVTGCLAVLEKDIESLQAMPEVFRVVPNDNKTALPGLIDPVCAKSERTEEVKEKVTSFASHTRAFLKIQDGCDQRCSYCKVNLVRGKSRSKDKKKIIKELKGLISKGYREIVLTGICLGAWQGENNEKLSDLLREIEKIKSDFRIRLSSIEPNYIDDSLIEAIASSKKICRHLHVPLQSGSDGILKLMNRKYDTFQFWNLIGVLRKRMPDIGITMDVILGFPGETEIDFGRTLAFIREIKPSRVHAFGYSDRKGTPSSKMKSKVPKSEIKRRVTKMIDLGEELQREACNRFIDKEVEVLIEKKTPEGVLTGYTGEYLKVKLSDISARKGSLVRAIVSEIEPNSPCLVIKNLV
jgi:threonylcarbamoyladenosine tRNA methylthiotransferase MtaB